MYFSKNNGLIREVIRNPKLGMKKVSIIGKYYAFNDGFDGYGGFEVEGLPATPTEKEFLEGNTDRLSYYVPSDVASIVIPLDVLFPNCTVYIVGNTEQVVSGLPDANAVAIVPNTMKSSYLDDTVYSTYQNLTFDSWILQNEFPIPFIGETTLTAEYIQQVVSMAGGQITVVTKVIIPSDFTDYGEGALDELFTQFPNLEQIESPWLNGVIADGLEWTISPEQSLDSATLQTEISHIGTLLSYIDKLKVKNNVKYDCFSPTNVDGRLPNITSLEITGALNTQYREVTSVGGLTNLVFLKTGSFNSSTWNGLGTPATLTDIEIGNFSSSGHSGFGYNVTNITHFKAQKATGGTLIITNIWQWYALANMQTFIIEDMSSITSATLPKFSKTNIDYRLGKINCDIDLSGTDIAHDALVYTLENALEQSSSKTLTIGSTNLAKLTQAEIDAFTAKGWTLQ